MINLEEAFAELYSALDDVDEGFGELVSALVIKLQMIEIVEGLNHVWLVLDVFLPDLIQHIEADEDCQRQILSELTTITTMLSSELVCNSSVYTRTMCQQVQKTINEAINTTANIPIPEVSFKSSALAASYDIVLDHQNKISSWSRHSISPLTQIVKYLLQSLHQDWKESISEFIQELKDDLRSINLGNSASTSLQQTVEFHLDLYQIVIPVLCLMMAFLLLLILISFCCSVFSTQEDRISVSPLKVMMYTNTVMVFLVIPYLLVGTGGFVFGALSEGVVCKTMEDPTHSHLYRFISPLITDIMREAYDEDDDDLIFDLGEAISSLHTNTPLYQVVKLKYLYDVRNLLTWQSDSHIDIILKRISFFLWIAIVNFHGGVLEKGKELQEVSNTVDHFLENIDSLLSSNSLATFNQTIEDMERIQRLLPMDTSDEFTKILDQVVQQMKMLEENIVGKVQNVFTIIKYLTQPTKDISSKVEEIYTLIDAAFLFVSDPGGVISVFLKASVERMIAVVDSAAEYAVETAETKIGKTGVVSHMYNNTMSGVCDGIIQHVHAGNYSNNISRLTIKSSFISVTFLMACLLPPLLLTIGLVFYVYTYTPVKFNKGNNKLSRKL